MNFKKILNLSLSFATLSTITCNSLIASELPYNLNSNQKRKLASAESIVQAAQVVTFFDPSTINSAEVKYKDFNLNSTSDIQELRRFTSLFLKEYENRKNSKFENQIKQFVISHENIKPYNEFDFTDGALKDAAKMILELCENIEKGDQVIESKFKIAQLARSIQQKYTPPLKTTFEILKVPIYIVRYYNSPKVNEKSFIEDDASLNFLRKQLVQEVDFSKTNFIDAYKFNDSVESCTYLKAKRGYGAHAGFQITCGKNDYKIKFGSSVYENAGNERYSGPANTRIYRSLGYLSPQINFYEKVNVKYDRNIILEFNERAIEEFKIKLLGIPLYITNNKKFIDPFLFIEGVKLKSGEIVRGAEARKKLLPTLVEISRNVPKSEIKTMSITADMINTEFESQIDSLIYSATTLTLKDDKQMGEEVGPWKPKDLIYKDLKEVRGLMVLAAWTGNFDIRKDNLRLNIIKNDKDEKELRLVFSDAGSGLGKAWVIGKTGSEINDMFWTVTRKNPGSQHYDKVQFPAQLEIYGIKNLEPTSAFNTIEMSDAQWMLRKICKFTPKQIKDILITSGLSSAEVLLAQAKLLERRNQMISDFKMTEELSSHCLVPVNRLMNYDPRVDGLVTSQSEKGELAIAPFRNQIIQNGVVVKIQ